MCKVKNMKTLKIELKDSGKCLSHKQVDFRVEVKQVEDEDSYFRFEGYGSTFGNVDKGDDVIVKGSFIESLSKEMPIILWQHDRYEPIGVPEVAVEDDKGLKLQVIMPKEDTFVSGRVMPQLRIGSVKKMSIGYIVREFHIVDGIRFITKADLKEVSLVTFPMNDRADVTSVKSFNVKDVEQMTRRDLEKTLRESALFSKEAATLIASKFPEKAGEPSSDELFNEEAILAKCAEIHSGKPLNADAEKKALELIECINKA